ncbi:hypothetical protein FA13DRAFT_199924 [Coprinellus micaceus]|uniref:Uncharacterized protein n=1 Tax=Coprinellus micaceus TaxID=71717 RepID=A0A4Y7SGL7_COPMI|nr:hypothetical protein FA13DRAFT_199924 [Coprinellus micaceus]
MRKRDLAQSARLPSPRFDLPSSPARRLPDPTSNSDLGLPSDVVSSMRMADTPYAVPAHVELVRKEIEGRGGEREASLSSREEKEREGESERQKRVVVQPLVYPRRPESRSGLVLFHLGRYILFRSGPLLFGDGSSLPLRSESSSLIHLGPFLRRLFVFTHPASMVQSRFNPSASKS